MPPQTHPGRAEKHLGRCVGMHGAHANGAQDHWLLLSAEPVLRPRCETQGPESEVVGHRRQSCDCDTHDWGWDRVQADCLSGAVDQMVRTGSYHGSSLCAQGSDAALLTVLVLLVAALRERHVRMGVERAEAASHTLQACYPHECNPHPWDLLQL